jgi:hypothetical protein
MNAPPPGVVVAAPPTAVATGTAVAAMGTPPTPPTGTATAVCTSGWMTYTVEGSLGSTTAAWTK